MAAVLLDSDAGGLGFEETELRLGLGLGLGLRCGAEEGAGAGGSDGLKSSGKRGFADTIDLKLKLQTSCGGDDDAAAVLKGVLDGITTGAAEDAAAAGKDRMKNPAPAAADPEKPPAKAQVVGWPPVRSFRKNVLSVKKEEGGGAAAAASAAFVKVSMDGAPYLRKVDLKMYRCYQDLSAALEKMFSSFTGGSQGMNGCRDFMNESKLMDLLNGSEYVPTYEDKDGDWMLVGDVPWGMFVESCKRLRIMKGSEAIGIAPKAVEKCKNRS